MPARIITFSIEIRLPSWLERPAVKAVLLYRRLRYGYAFRRIPLSRGKYAIVDPDDYGWLSKYNWHIVGDRGTFYAVRNTGQRQGEKRIVVKMHREILKVPDGMFVDHINHDGLDNRRANLRPATQAQNARNRRKVHRSSYHSNYKGLTWYKGENRWAVRIMVDNKSKFIGYFDNELAAARAYDKAAQKYHGQFASLNFPDVTAEHAVRAVRACAHRRPEHSRRTLPSTPSMPFRRGSAGVPSLSLRDESKDLPDETTNEQVRQKTEDGRIVVTTNEH